MREDDVRIGLISDTHGWLRPEVLGALEGVSAVVHAGDVGHPAVLDGLRALGPVHAVRGNVDEPAAVARSRRRDAPDPGWARTLPTRLDLVLGGLRLRVVHTVDDAGPLSDVDVLVTGHSHVPRIEKRGAVLHVNPGSAGPRRFRLPVTCALLERVDGRTAVRIVSLVPTP